MLVFHKELFKCSMDFRLINLASTLIASIRLLRLTHVLFRRMRDLRSTKMVFSISETTEFMYLAVLIGYKIARLSAATSVKKFVTMQILMQVVNL